MKHNSRIKHPLKILQNNFLKIYCKLTLAKKEFKGSRPEAFLKMFVLKDFVKLTEKHLCQRRDSSTGVSL